MSSDRLAEMLQAVERGEIPLEVYADALEDEGHPLAVGVRWLAENDRRPIIGYRGAFEWYSRSLDATFRHWLPRCIADRLNPVQEQGFAQAIERAAAAVQESLADGTLAATAPESIHPLYRVEREQPTNYLLLGVTVDPTIRAHNRRIVELAAITVHMATLERQSVYRTYVRTSMRLSEFCTEEVGVSAAVVRKSAEFAESLDHLLKWAEPFEPYAVVYWGETTLQQLRRSCRAQGTLYPFVEHVDLRSYVVAAPRMPLDPRSSDPLGAVELADRVAAAGSSQPEELSPHRARRIVEGLSQLLSSPTVHPLLDGRETSDRNTRLGNVFGKGE